MENPTDAKSSADTSRQPHELNRATQKTDVPNETTRTDGDGSQASQEWVMDTSGFPGPRALALIMIGLPLAMFINNLGATIIAIAIPYITDEFHTMQDVGWYVSSTFLIFASFQSTWDKACKCSPLKTTPLFSLFVFKIGHYPLLPDHREFVLRNRRTSYLHHCTREKSTHLYVS
ncbi:hypothetical protein F4819DRAFT_203459 [Hypoxylon fuscum]|nr:hypothetical protein F4819DRAFT_203459 [Hypoxylon fuscum]